MFNLAFQHKIEKVFSATNGPNSLSLLITGLPASEWLDLSETVFNSMIEVKPESLNYKTHPDFIWIETEDGLKSIGIKPIRAALRKVSLCPHELGFKLVLIPEANLLTHQAQNALLKIVEEPPSKTFFLLGADFRGQLLPTILSRCEHLPYFEKQDLLVEEWLNENMKDLTETQRKNIIFWSEGDRLKARDILNSYSDWQDLDDLYAEVLKGNSIESLKSADKFFSKKSEKIMNFLKIVVLREKAKIHLLIAEGQNVQAKKRLELLKETTDYLRQLENPAGSAPKSILQTVVLSLSSLAKV